MPRMVSAVFEPATVIAMHTSLSPTNAEWDEYLALIEQTMKTHGQVRCVIVTDGGAPSLDQRARLNALVDAPAVLLTDALLMRHVMRARGMFNPSMQSFAPEQFAEAFKFVGVEANAVMRTLYQLQQALPPLRTYRAMHQLHKTAVAKQTVACAVTAAD